MSYTTKQNESDARERLRAFWAGASLGRPALNVVVKRADFIDTPSPWHHLDLKARDLLPEYHGWAGERAPCQVRYLAEAMPGFHVNWGSFLTTLPVLAGGDYEYHDSAWILPLPDLYDRPLPVFDPAHPLVRQLDTCYRALQQGVGNRGFVSPPLMMDGLTTLSLFRAPDQLCVDMLETPELVKSWATALNRLYIDIYEHYYRMLGARESLCFFGPMAEGRSEGVQCDFAVMLSPAMYEEFVLPDLLAVTNYFDRSLYHLDGTCQLRFLDHLRAMPKLSGIQWNPETTAGPLLGWLDAFKEIRRHRFSLMIWTSVADAIEITRHLGPDGLFLILPAFESEGEAEEAITAITRVC